MAKLCRRDLEHGVARPGYGQWTLDTRETVTAEGLRSALRAGEGPTFQ